MEVDAYVQARYGRLLEHAVELGVPEGEGPAYVDQVLLEQRRAIRRAEDPDPLVREALAKAIRGEREHSRSWIGIALVLAVVAAVGIAALLIDPAPQPLPSLLGYQGREAEARLMQAGLDVQLRPARACEPQDLVLGTTPVAGTLVSQGETVSVRVASPSSDCLPEAQLRREAWDVVRFARGLGPAPDFAETLTVVVDGGEERTLGRSEAARRDSWGPVLDTISRQAERAAPTPGGLPRLDVSQGVPPASTCGTDRPTGAAGRETLRLVLDATGGGAACALTVDLYRSAGGIDAVVVYTPNT